ncbi:MAG: efflux RND transporter permease subunit [Ignavibacteria bacterium]|jgi:HAE1 family hydrophobic/amphiphilic exporter-1|nr:efflux RND transporter permease subunit [Ignavibacteria bacterium]MCU7517007.1 efflux RND transporter permease subunit [Ignavibacteria bacterium]
MNISKLSVNRPTLVIVFFTVLVFLGFFSYKNLNYELMPEFSSPVMTILTVYPGASPYEVENSVTKKIEDVITTVENVENIRSFSQEGYSLVLVELKLSADMNNALQDAQRKINSIKSTLPESILEPTLTRMSINDLPIMNLGVTSKMSEIEFYDLLKHRIQPELSRVEGVGEVTLVGGNEREIRVSLDQTRLETYKLPVIKVLQAIEASNMDFPTGRIKSRESQMVIRLSAKFKTKSDIENVVVASSDNGSPIKLKDIAEILDTEKDPSTIARVNGINSIGLSIKKQAGSNTVKVSHLVQDELKRLTETYKNYNLKFQIPMNSSEFTEKAASSVMSDLGYAILLVSLVMLVFLHSLRNAFIVMLAVPLSLVISFLGMYLLNYTLNMMTLLALSLVIGILVDDAIVVLENIYRHLEMGKDKVKATLDGRSEIGFTAVAITLVDVVVFLPIALSKSIISPIIAPYAMVIVITTLLSMLVAFTAVPLLTSRLGKLQHLDKRSITGRFTLWFESLVNAFSSVIHNILIWSFRHKALTFIIAGILFFGSVALIPAGFVGSEFASFGDAGEFIVQIELPKDATLEETNLKVLEIEQVLFNKPEVKTVFSTIGSSSSGMLGSSGGAYKAEIDVKLVEKEYRDVTSQIYAHKIKNELAATIVGAKINTALVNPFFGGTDDAPIQVVVKSDNPDSLNKYGTRIKKLVENTAGTRDVKSSLESAGPELLVEIDKEKMASLGLSLAEVGPVMQTAFSGNTDAKFKDGSYEYDINVILDQFNRQRASDVANLCFTNSSGEQVKLIQFAKIGYGTGSTKLDRYDRTSSVLIEGQVLGRASGDVGDDIKGKIAQLKLPDNVSISYDGDMKYQSEAFGSLGFALIASIFLVYMIMVALYESFLYPFVVLFSIPLAIIGAIISLALTKSTLSLFSLMGMVMLVGLVAKNAIIVVDFTNHLRKSGYGTMRALLTSTRLRLRPVLMTTMSMVIGLLPIALASGPASEWKNGLAWVLIGGLSSSMLLTLIIVPVVYLITDNIKERALKRSAGKKLFA